jgi:hypothetical protein
VSKYHEHLRSEYWQRVRKAQFTEQDGICSVCNKHLSATNFETHHYHYKNLYHELDHAARVGRESQIAPEIDKLPLSRAEKEAMWREKTKDGKNPHGKSIRAFYRRLAGFRTV